MNPHDKAHELARAIESSDAFLRARSAKQALEQDPSALEMVKDFKRRQFTLQAKQMSGQSLTEEDLNQLQKLGEVVQMNQDAQMYLQADMELQVLFMDVQKILSDVTDKVSILSIEEMYQEMGRSE